MSKAFGVLASSELLKHFGGQGSQNGLRGGMGTCDVWGTVNGDGGEGPYGGTKFGGSMPEGPYDEAAGAVQFGQFTGTIMYP
jgi:hypothetical protein